MKISLIVSLLTCLFLTTNSFEAMEPVDLSKLLEEIMDPYDHEQKKPSLDMKADNNLYSFAGRNLKEMKRSMNNNTNNVNIIVTLNEEQTIEYYNISGKDWALHRKMHTNQSRWLTELEKFKNLLPNGKILEVGSGAGTEANWFIQHEYEYIGLEPSSGFLSFAQKKFPNICFKNKSVYEISNKYTFDGFWTAATLLHIPKKRIKEALKKIHNVLHQDGIGFISIIEGKGEEVESDTKRLFALYQDDEFRRILSEVGFDVIEYIRTTKPTRNKTWLCYFVRKR